VLSVRVCMAQIAKPDAAIIFLQSTSRRYKLLHRQLRAENVSEIRFTFKLPPYSGYCILGFTGARPSWSWHQVSDSETINEVIYAHDACSKTQDACPSFKNGVHLFLKENRYERGRLSARNGDETDS
jgi:hypothetical protein